MGYKGDDIAIFTHTSGTSSSVSIGFNISWDVEIDNTFQAINVDTTSEKVCGKK